MKCSLYIVGRGCVGKVTQLSFFGTFCAACLVQLLVLRAPHFSGSGNSPIPGK